MKSKSLLMIPGPIEFDQDVLAEMAKPTSSHVDPDFIEIFGQTLEQLRQIFMCPSGQPFIVAGSGTLAMDMAAANLVEPGTRVLVINTGYFGDRFADIMQRYGAEVTQLKAPIGGIVDLERIEKEIQGGDYNIVTITQVDTSTGVLNKVKEIALFLHTFPALIVVDGVCSVAGEEMDMVSWGVDLAFTASQKAIGVPPGLALMVASERAMERFKNRKQPVANYYADWKNWLPVMQAYENRKAAYFGTPPVNLIKALHLSLGKILAEGLAERQKRHKRIGTAFKQAMHGLGLCVVPHNFDIEASTMTAPYYPTGISGSEFLALLRKEGLVAAGGLHPEIKTKYFRIGHMGSTDLLDMISAVAAIEVGLAKCGQPFEPGVGLSAAMKSYLET